VSFGHPIVGLATVRGVTVLDTSSGLIGSARTYTDLDLWRYQTGAGITAPPAIVDGAVYVGSGDGKLYAFTSYGQLPAAAVMR
jgi:outer membrane protein assembly factor BamB